MQVGQVQVFVQILLVTIDGDFAQLQLFLLRLEAGRLQAMDAQHLTLRQRKGETLEDTANSLFVVDADISALRTIAVPYSGADRANDRYPAPYSGK